MFAKSFNSNVSKKTTYHSNNLHFFFFTLLLIILINCESDKPKNIFVIPFKTFLPNTTHPNPANLIMSQWLKSKTYFITENPNKQKIEIILSSTNEKLMYTRNNLTVVGSDESSYEPYSENIGDMCSFNSNDSSTFNFYNCNLVFHSIDNNNCYAKEKFKFFDDLSLKNSKFYDLEFIHPTNKSGICFLSSIDIIDGINKQYNFFSELKNLLDSAYSWTLKYTSSDEGYFIFGDIIGNKKITFYNENIEQNFYSETMPSITDRIFWRFQISKIYFDNNLYNITQSLPVYIHLDFNSRFITLPKNDYLNFKNLFNISDGTGCSDLTVEYHLYCAYCNKKKYLDVTDNYKKLPTINFEGPLQINITFVPKDLFIEKDDKIFFLIAYDGHREDDWYFGNIFLQKYTVVFDNGNRKLSVLKKVNFDGDENSNSVLKIVLIVVLCIVLSGLVFGFLGIKYGKQLYQRRRKKANELDDDEYDYVQKNDVKEGNGILESGVN